MDNAYRVTLKEISFFVPSEEIDMANAAQLADSIESDGYWLAPIPVERTSGIIMDGNHRLHAGRLLALSHLPCILLDYDDARVSVVHWETGHPFEIGDIHRTLSARKLLPYKTTRHAFEPLLPRTDIPLAALRRHVAAWRPHDRRAAGLESL